MSENGKKVIAESMAFYFIDLGWASQAVVCFLSASLTVLFVCRGAALRMTWTFVCCCMLSVSQSTSQVSSWLSLDYIDSKREERTAVLCLINSCDQLCT